MTEARRINPALLAATFGLVAVAGLLYVKWLPYYHRAFVAAASHAIGPSILTGEAPQAPAPSLDAALGYALAYGRSIWKAMVLGLVLGAGVQALLPADWIARLLGRRRFGSVLAGGLLSLPAMMCSCCAAPVAIGLRRSRATPGAAVAFWLGNSVLNPATLVFIAFVLGWRWAALRLVLGALMVFGLGYLANRMSSSQEEVAERVAPLPPETTPVNPFRRWLSLLLAMSARLIPEYVVLVLLLGAARAWLFPVIGPQVDNHLIWIAAFALAGAVFVIPTAGEAPIIQAMLALGLGAGPAGALLMTLPPISLPSLAMVGRALSLRILAMVSLGVVLFGLIGGGIAAALHF